MQQYQQQRNNLNQIRTFFTFKIFTDKVYERLEHSKLYYPHFKEWYYSNVIPSVVDGDKEFIFEIRNHKIVGIAIIKHSQKKLCHLSIFDEYKNKGYGLSLFEKVFDKLNTRKPYLTVSEEKYIEFKKIFNYYNFELSDKKIDIYRNNKIEYYFNEYD
jgi:hypothetical protein